MNDHRPREDHETTDRIMVGLGVELEAVMEKGQFPCARTMSRTKTIIESTSPCAFSAKCQVCAASFSDSEGKQQSWQKLLMRDALAGGDVETDSVAKRVSNRMSEHLT